MARLPNTLNHPDPGELRERAVRAMHTFEQPRARLDLPRELLAPAHYALCASIDDVVLNTPWGSTGVWDANSLVSIFHKEVRSGERFFQLLAQMRQNPGLYLPVIELMYLCMSLGVQGQYRLSPRGPAELDRLREETYAVIVRQRQSPEPDLSPHWKGVAAPYRGIRATVPVWVAASVALAVLAGLFLWFSASAQRSLGRFVRPHAGGPAGTHAGDRARRAGAPASARRPARAGRRGPAVRGSRTRGQAGAGDGASANRRTRSSGSSNRGMFASGSATIEPSFVPLLKRIGAALKDETGEDRGDRLHR